MSAPTRISLVDETSCEADVEAVLDCLRSGWLTMGPRTQALEQRLGELTGAAHALAVSSGTAGLQLALQAAGVGRGDEVVVPALAPVSAAAAVAALGAVPVLCDVADPLAPHAGPKQVEPAIGPRTRAIVAVHLHGHLADAAALRELADARGLVLVEDCSSALGAPGAGVAGALGVFSFAAGRQLAIGEGGLVVAADESHAARVRSLRSHAMTSGTWDRHRGHDPRYDVVDAGYNFRLDEPRAALALTRLERLAGEVDGRRALLARARERLRGRDDVALVFNALSVEAASPAALPLALPDGARRDRFAAALDELGVPSETLPALHAFSAYREVPGGARPQAEAAAARTCLLPLYAALGDDGMGFLLDAVEQALTRTG
ncbi:DegT/DnrJ/EryC1/StrS family aminotransferase [Conexibacter arvalis]|uniref:dTDP-4-amino-4,6-dideoxygalactose transaminase n=1 Tax=Conexibacter arvalis TaxID=912552 RepID=A0A840IC63_9ACTN|nr:DegT/DnrJ/EryC1/StrS aminotransferase family protein [Conexibacter arvalis]MBB4661648.1 dTDP-4-amino-4,6-dideoxygalactose transaminase [Conexibacter arvalis]